MCRGVLKYYGILLGGGGSPQNVHKRSLGGAGLQQKITEDHDHNVDFKRIMLVFLFFWGGDAKKLAILKVLIKKRIIPRTSYHRVA